MAGKTACCCGMMPWFKEGAPLRYPALSENVQTEVLVVGGGLSGLLSAYFLVQAGVDCVLVEQGLLGGASKFFGGFSCDGGSSLTKLFSLYSRENALRLWQSICQTVRDVETFVSDVAPGCGYKQKDSFFFTQKEENISDMKEEFRLRNFSGFPCEFIGADDALSLFSFPVCGGVYVKNCGGEINPVALADGVASRLTLCGGRIYEESSVVSMRKKNGNFFVSKTKNGFEITSKAVCDCRGVELLKRYPGMGKRKTVFSLCSDAAPNLSGWPGRCVMKNDEKKRPLFIFGADSERVVLQGEESGILTPSGGFHGIETGFLFDVKKESLKIQAEEMFLGESLSFPFFGAAGMVCTSDGLPYAGEDRNLPGYYYVCGDGRNAVVNAIHCGRLIAGLYTGNGKETSDLNASLFSMREPE